MAERYNRGRNQIILLVDWWPIRLSLQKSQQKSFIFLRMSLVLYSSSESDNEECASTEESKNDRMRSFPHEEGNWALSIYAFGKNWMICEIHRKLFFRFVVDCSSHMDTMIDDLLEIFNEKQKIWKRLGELHISLSKTFPVRFLHIESIRQSLQNELASSMNRFATRIENITILNNDDSST